MSHLERAALDGVSPPLCCLAAWRDNHMDPIGEIIRAAHGLIDCSHAGWSGDQLRMARTIVACLDDGPSRNRLLELIGGAT